MTVATHDPDQCRRRDCRQRWRMARRLSNIEMAAVATMVISAAMIAFVAFSIWAEP
jgi:hypothetical protein